MPRSWEGTGRGRNGSPLIAGDYSLVLDHEQPQGSESVPVHARSQLGLGDAAAEPCPHAGPLSHGASHFEELGVNAWVSPPPLFFFFIHPPFLSQQPTGSKRPFAVVKATPYHEDGAVKWQQPRALLSISAASLARPWCRCQQCCSVRARATPRESAGGQEGTWVLPRSLPGPGPAARNGGLVVVGTNPPWFLPRCPPASGIASAQTHRSQSPVTPCQSPTCTKGIHFSAVMSPP